MVSISRDEDVTTDEIGGYLELALPNFGDPFPAPFIKYQSARAALRAAIEASALTRVLLPAYVCEAVVQAVTDSGRTIEFYGLNADLLPIIDNRMAANTGLLYVNYFGLCDNQVLHILKQYPAEQLFIDNTQALFSCTSDRCVTIHSPRKFVGLPDGGILRAVHLPVKVPDSEDENSVGRMNHLLVRLAEGARSGYAHFLLANRSLRDTRPLRMSRLTERLLSSIDFEAVRERRRANFQRLSQGLGEFNGRDWPLGSEATPLCYPLVLKNDVAPIRKSLASQSVFVPSYWEEARHRIGTTGIESTLLDHCLALPCDQRCTEQHIARLIGIVKREIRELQAYGS